MLHTIKQFENFSENKVMVAAIIPLYNGSAYIRESLGSVVSQTEPVKEIIVVDDGSTDDGAGAAIVREMARYHPITLISQKNGGIGAARNRGIAESTASHIALLDQDDIWYEDHIAVLKQPFVAAENRNLGWVYGNLDRVDKRGRMIQQCFLDVLKSQQPKTSLVSCLSRDMFVLPGASIISRTAFDAVGGFDERLSGYEDDDLFLRMFSAGFTSVYLRKNAVTKWRIHGESTSYSPRMAESRMIYFRKLIEEFPDDHAMHHYLSRDVIAPRFFWAVRNDFIEGLRLNDLPRRERALSNLREIALVMQKRIRQRVNTVLPVVGALHRHRRFAPFVRFLLSFARPKRKS